MVWLSKFNQKSCTKVNLFPMVGLFVPNILEYILIRIDSNEQPSGKKNEKNYNFIPSRSWPKIQLANEDFVCEIQFIFHVLTVIIIWHLINKDIMLTKRAKMKNKTHLKCFINDNFRKQFAGAHLLSLLLSRNSGHRHTDELYTFFKTNMFFLYSWKHRLNELCMFTVVNSARVRHVWINPKQYKKTLSVCISSTYEAALTRYSHHQITFHFHFV